MPHPQWSRSKLAERFFVGAVRDPAPRSKENARVHASILGVRVVSEQRSLPTRRSREPSGYRGPTYASLKSPVLFPDFVPRPQRDHRWSRFPMTETWAFSTRQASRFVYLGFAVFLVFDR